MKETLRYVLYIFFSIQILLFGVWISPYGARSYEQFLRLVQGQKKAGKSEPRCPLVPAGLAGRIKINKTSQTWEAIEKTYAMVKNGQYKPENCSSHQKVAILIPFRDRESHLKVFLHHMHSFLMKQQLQYGIYVVEQTKGLPFNRGILFNIGFKEASNDSNYDCFVLHDVDLLPENEFNIYTCPVDHPKHLSAAIDNFRYKLPYNSNFGGVTAMTKKQFEAINGFSNLYYGWGGEDDDLYNRVVWANMSIARARNGVGRYSSLQHKKAAGNPHRMKLLGEGKDRMWKDGLNTLKYEVIQKTHKKLYIHITVKPTVNDVVSKIYKNKI